MKRILAWILALAMALTLAACGSDAEQTRALPENEQTEETAQPDEETTEPDAEEQPAAAAFPAVGDRVEGFTVTDVRDFPLVGAQIALFEHDKTGARLMYIANGDTNRVFDLSFFTRAVDNSGLPHVFEHSTLDGSEKYPSKALFFNLSYQTYNTYMNAYTQQLLTSYPVASLSEAQLLKYADYYTDSCLHPMIMEDESIFREEAWRYRMADMDSPLTIEGTVYSEMQGALDLNSASSVNMYRTTFPGSQVGNVSGGDPAFIVDMTWDSLKDYHDEYYHPSNCLAFLYGEFEDYTAFLRLLDEAFSPYEKREFNFEDPDYAPLSESVQVETAFPMEAGSDTENRSVIYYSFLCPGLKDDEQEELVLNTLTDLLAPASSPLMQSLNKALPSGQFGTYIETQSPDDAIVFYGANLNREDAEIFKKTIDEGLAAIAEDGFAQDYVDGLMASLSLSMKLTGETSRGTDLISSIVFSYATSGNYYSYLDYIDALNRLADWNDEGLYTEAIKNWLLDEGTVTALSVTYPEPGAREELDAKETERLAELKAAMSEEELQAIVARSNAEEEEEDASALVAQLQGVTVDSLPEEVRDYEVKDETGADGVRRMSAEAGVDGVGQAILLLDAAGLRQEQLHYFALYTALLGEMDSSKHSVEELGVLMTRYLYNGEIRLSLMTGQESGSYHPYLRCSWVAADEDLEQGYELMRELLFDTQFDDAETLQGLISRAKASLKSDITSSPYTYMLYRGFGASSGLYAYYSYFNGLDYYAFLEEVEQQAQDDPGAVAEQLRAVQDYFHNSTNAVSLYAGSAAGVERNREQADAFLAALDSREVEEQSYAFEKPARREALIVDSSVQYNGIVADFATMGLAEYSADLDAVTSLVTDLYLYPKLRDQYGAYGTGNGASEDIGMYVYSYRDPNVKESFDVYDAMPAFLAELDVDQETLDGYILSSYSGYAMPEGELSGAISALINVLCGDGVDVNLRHMRALKALTPEKLKSYAAAYEKLAEEGLRFTAGGAAAINANAELFDVILNPFGAVDVSELSFSDLTEEHPHYADTQLLLEEGVLLPLENDFFGVDEPATLGDLAGVLYALLDGSASDQEEAVELFAQYSIVDADGKAGDPLTGKAAETVLRKFTDAVGMDFTADANAGEAVLTRGELATRVVQYLRDLGLLTDDE